MSSHARPVSGSKPPTKKQLLKVIDDLERSPSDRVRILGDLGITSMGAALGAAGAGTVATLAGATSAFSLFGMTIAAATPVGWVVGTALAGGALAYGVSRLIRSGGLSEGRKRELLQVYRERLQEMQRLERAQSITEPDRNRFIASLREVVAKDAISVEKAFQLIEAVENGAMPISTAYELVVALLENNQNG